jgi:hypothetical protein
VINKAPPSGENNEQFRDCCIWAAAASMATDRVVHLLSADTAFMRIGQLALVMTAAKPLDPSKRATLLERIASHLRCISVRRPTDSEVDRAIKAAMSGLLQGSAA